MPQYILRGRRGDQPIRHDLRPGTQTLGRDTLCDIRLDDHAVSRRHAEVVVEGDSVLVRDLGSLNGTFVNGKQIEGEIILEPGGKLRIGHAEMTLSEREPTQFGDFAPEGTMATFTTSVREIRAQAESSQSSKLLAALHDAGQMLSRSLELNDLYEHMLDLVSRFIRADRILILPPEIREGNPEPLASRLTESLGDEPLRMSRTILRQIMEDGRAFITADAATDPKLAATKSLVGTGIHAAMGAPLFDNDTILGAIYVDSKVAGLTYDEENLRLLTLLANMIAVKITNSRFEEAEREQERIRQEIALASRIQRKLLPQSVPTVERYQIYAHQTPCYEVGGDLYDVRVLPDGRVWLVLGDVSGKGVGASLLMAHVMASLRVLEDECSDPLELVARVESYLEQHVEPEQFVTLFAGLLDPATGRLTYVNAGHNPPLVLCGTTTKTLDATGLAVAMLPGMVRETMECTMEDAGTLLIFSDGVVETENEAGEYYGEGPMQELLEGAANMDADDLGHRLVEEVETYRGEAGPSDDLTLLIVRRPGPAAP